MFPVILSTLAMMAGAFIIGFAVAYLIKFISLSLNFIENFSLKHTILLYKRFYSIRKIHEYNIQQALQTLQSNMKDDMLDYFYPNKDKVRKEMNTQEETNIIFSYHGNR